MIECIGIQEKSGKFEADNGKTVEYDNVMIYYITDDNPEVCGYYGKEQKVSKLRVEPINFREWTELIGKRIEFVFNVFGNAPRLTGVKIVGEGCITKWMGEHLTKQG